MRKFSIAAFAATLVVGTGAALADDARSPFDPTNFFSQSSGNPALFTGTALDENFETFTPGVFPQNGWTSNFDPNFTFTTGPTINGVSWRHTSDASGVADFGFAPTIAPPQFGLFEYDFQLNSNGTVYGNSPVNSVDGLINTRLLYNADGTIDALQAVGGAGVFSDTTGTWTSGVTMRMGVEVLADGTLNVYQNGALIFSGTDIPFALNGASTGIDTFQFESFNDAAGSSNDFALMDNFVTAVPEPGSMALLGLGGLALLRRRRA